MGIYWLFVYVTSLILFAFVSGERLDIIRKFIEDVVTSCETDSIERMASDKSDCHPCNITNVQQYIEGVNFTSSDGVLRCSWKSYAGPGNISNPRCTITSLNQACSSLEGNNVDHLVIQCPELLVFDGNLLTSNLDKIMENEYWPLYDKEWPPNDDEIPNILKKFAHFEMLFDVNGTGMTNLSMFHNTTILTISSCRLNFQTLATMVKQLNLHNLEELHMENINYPMLSEKFNLDIFYMFQNISTLSIANSIYSNNYFSSEHLKLFPGIRHFQLANVNITPLGWDNIFHWMPKLSNLTIDLTFVLLFKHSSDHFSKFIRTAIPWNDISNMHRQELQVLITLPYSYEDLYFSKWNFSYMSLSDLSPFQFSNPDDDNVLPNTLDLSHNELTELTMQFDNTSLSLLDVGYNSITNLQSTTCRLHGLGQLVHLVLSHNRIKSIDSTCFSQLSNLLDLRLDHNEISYISRKVFSAISRLQFLSLDHNEISFISEDAFQVLQPDSLPGLYQGLKLNLSHNYLNQVPFFYPTSIESMDLSSNPFTQDQGFGNKSYLEHLFNVTLGDWKIKSSRFSDVEKKYKIAVTALKPSNSIPEAVMFNTLLHFRNNPGFHYYLYRDIKIYLRYVNIGSLGLDFFLNFTQQFNIEPWYGPEADPDQVVFDDTHLDMMGSELHCGCPDIYTYFILNSIYRGRSYKPSYYRDKWICTSPLDVAGVPFLQISQRVFKSCTKNLANCPTNCTCFHSINNMDRITVDCTETHFTELPSIVPEGTELLHMPRSNLTSLCGRHEYMSKLIEIDVSGNFITEVCEDFVSELDAIRLKHLNLQHNYVQNLPQNMKALENTTILLKGNIMACSCENIWLKYWLSSSDSLLIPDTKSLRCKNDENSYFLEIDDTILSDRCTDKTVHVSWLGLAIGSSVALTLVLLVMALIYKFWKSIKVWCFMKFNWHPFDQGDLNDNIENMDYDVFISYSHSDLQWVRENLVVILQNHGYSVCLHEKDWPVGVLITENILLSVKHSRRMIMVLSENYLTSEWCRIEFQAAHKSILEGRTKYLIMIALDDVDMEKLPPEMDLYVKMHTYLEADNEWFQKRLIYAMPQKPLAEMQAALNQNDGNNVEMLRRRRFPPLFYRMFTYRDGRGDHPEDDLNIVDNEKNEENEENEESNEDD